MSAPKDYYKPENTPEPPIELEELLGGKKKYVQDGIFHGKVSNKLSDYKNRDEMRREQKHLKAFLKGHVYYNHGRDIENKPKKHIVGGRTFQIQKNWMNLANKAA